MHERFTEQGRLIMRKADAYSIEWHHEKINGEHVLLGLLATDSSTAAEILRSLNADPKELHDALIGRLSREIETHGHRARLVIETAMKEATSLGSNVIGSEHLLLGILRLPLTPGNAAGHLLQNAGVSLDAARAELQQITRSATVAASVDTPKVSDHRNERRFVRAKFLGVKHEGLFEITEGMSAGEIVRMPFTDGDYAEEMAPALDRLMNSGSARNAAQELLDALTLFLDDGDGGESGLDVLKRAGQVLNAIEAMREEIDPD